MSTQWPESVGEHRAKRDMVISLVLDGPRCGARIRNSVELDATVQVGRKKTILPYEAEFVLNPLLVVGVVGQLREASLRLCDAAVYDPSAS